MAVLGDRGTSVLDMIIEGFRRSGQTMEQPNMSQVAPTPLQRAMNRPVSRLTSTGDVSTIMPDGGAVAQTSTPLLQNLARGRVLNPVNPMQDMGQPMAVSDALRQEAVSEALNSPDYGALVRARYANQEPRRPTVEANRLIQGREMQAGQGPMQAGMDRETALRAAKVAKDALDTGDESIISQVQDFFGGRENMLRMAMAFNTMRLEPDAQLTAALSKQLENVTVSSRAQQIAQALRAKGTPAAISAADYIERTGDYKGGYKMFRESGKVRQVSGAELNTQSGTNAYDETKMYNQNTVTGQITAVGGGGIDITLPAEGAEKKLFEQVGKGSGDMIIKQAEQLPDLQNQVANLQILDQLSEAMAQGTTAIPDFLKGSVPEGMNSTIDAYRAIVFTVAQGLRQAGTGPMTDKDFDILVSRAGSISADVNARRIAQAALRRAANNALRRARIAEKFRLNPTEEGQQQYVVEIETLNKELENGILTPNERTLLSQMGPQGQQPVYDTSNMDQATATYFNSLSAPAQAYFMSQSPAKQKELVDSGATR